MHTRNDCEGHRSRFTGSTQQSAPRKPGFDYQPLELEMQNSEQQAMLENAAIAPTDNATHVEPAIVPTADGLHAPRYGSMPYGGPQIDQAT